MTDFSNGTITETPTDGSRGANSAALAREFVAETKSVVNYVGGSFFLDDVQVNLAEEAIQKVTFLGGEVYAFNASLGWQGNRSECSISVVEDPDSDTVFQVPVVGSPQFFTVYSIDGVPIWNFNGLVRSITRDVDSARRSFTVSLESPNVILDSVSLIMSEFAGEGYTLDRQDRYLTTFNTRSYDWNKIYNALNIFGFWENDQYGTSQAGFGQSEINEVGIPWKKVVIALNEIINRTHTNNVTLNDGNNVLGGSLAFSSTSYNNGKPFLYCLDFDNLVDALVEAGIPESYRVNDVSSISDLINHLAELANIQWFCTLERNTVVRDTYNNELCAGIIRIYTTSLRELPRLDAISNFGISQEGAGADITQNRTNIFPDAINAYADDAFHKLEQSNLGIELADVVTGKVVVGAKRSSMFEYNQNNIYMYWGSLKPRQSDLDDLPLITPLLGALSREDVIPIDIRDIVGEITVGEFKQGKKYWNKPATLLPPTVFRGIYYASVMELRFAAIDYDNWESYLTNFCQKKSLDLALTGETRPFIQSDDSQSLHALLVSLGYEVNQDNLNLTRQHLQNCSGSFDDSVGIKNLQSLHDRLVSAFEMYGKEFMVPMPVTAYKWIPETSDFVSEWDIADSAYTDITIGPNSPNFDPKFLTDNGRTEAYSIFPARTSVIDARGRAITGALDFCKVDGEQFSSHGNSVYIKTSVDPKIYYIKQAIPSLPWVGEYTYYSGTSSFFYPELLTPSNPFLGSLPYGKPTTEFFGYYTDLRGALPFAHISLPSPVGYMKDALGLSMNFDGIGMIVREIEQDTINNNTGVGTDRYQAPIADGCVFPTMLSLPLQSNRHHYGPWVPRFNQNVAGKVEVEFDDNLAPENFSAGGYGYGFDAMDAVGYAKAMPDNIGYFATETGSFTMVGVSRVGLGQQIVAGGPYLTDMSVSIDNATVKTSFSMKTWNLDFGKMKRYYIDRMLRLSQTQVKVSKAKRESVTRFEKMVRNSSVAARYRGQSSSTMIAATIQPTAYYDPWQESLFNVSQVTASIMPAHNMMSHINSNYENTAACSLDAFFVPVTMYSQYSGILPKVTSPSMNSYTDSFALNPYMTSGWIGSSNFQSKIHNVHSVSRGQSLPPDLSVKHSMGSDDYLEDTYAQVGASSTDIRVVADRTPKITSGYGFDTNGSLSPSGVNRFVDTSSWNSGPDLKIWDKHKGIWMGGFPVMCGILKTNLGGGSLASPSSGNIIRVLRTPNGVKPVEIKPIFCFDGGFGTAPSGTLVYYTNWDGANVPLYVACSGTVETLTLMRNYNG